MKKNNQSIKNPLVSFCLSTYQRPDFLVATLKKILAQKYDHLEIIVCDNDPKGSSQKAVHSLKSKKVRYFVNSKNLGMVPSFNRAFSLSKGDLIVFMADDDPPYPNMLTELFKLYYKYPDCTSWFGAFDLFNEDPTLASQIKMKTGAISGRNFDWRAGEVKIFEPQEYLRLALNGDIFYYLMWSTGFVKREVVEALGKDPVPEYGSALMTDRCYALQVGAAGKTALVNTELGIQALHQRSFSLTESETEMLVKGFCGYYQEILPTITAYQLQKEHEQFLLRHVVNMFLIIKIANTLHGDQTDVAKLMAIFDTICVRVPILIKYRWQLELMLKYRFPFEIIFKAYYLPPEKLFKTAYRFLTVRLKSLQDLWI